MNSTTPAGLYLHIPFCTAKCPYCDFISTTDLDLLPDFLAALGKEIELRATDAFSFDSIYAGGGTPSLLTGDQVARLLRLARRHFSIAADAEITLEGNPGSLTPARLAVYREAGVNRLNIGIQAFADLELELLGRRHSVAQAAQAIQDARAAGFDNLGLDLIYGLPGQTTDSWQRSLDKALRAEPEHLSCYLLTFERGTRFDIRRRRDELQPLADAEQAKFIEWTHRYLKAAGYPAYEISNYARQSKAGGPDWRSRHNRKYWNHAPYLGLGPAAHSFVPPRRAWNVRGLQRYLNILAAGNLPEADAEVLTPIQERVEAIYLGLRQTRGVDTEAWAERFNESFEVIFRAPLARLEDAGQLVWRPPYYRLSAKGVAVADGVVGHLVSVLPCDADAL